MKTHKAPRCKCSQTEQLVIAILYGRWSYAHRNEPRKPVRFGEDGIFINSPFERRKIAQSTCCQFVQERLAGSRDQAFTQCEPREGIVR